MLWTIWGIVRRRSLRVGSWGWARCQTTYRIGVSVLSCGDSVYWLKPFKDRLTINTLQLTFTRLLRVVEVINCAGCTYSFVTLPPSPFSAGQDHDSCWKRVGNGQNHKNGSLVYPGGFRYNFLCKAFAGDPVRGDRERAVSWNVALDPKFFNKRSFKSEYDKVYLK
jgi:hypothetical protein